MTLDEQLMPGPCVICGLSNYPLSAGGPTICPSCDCGDFGPAKIERQRKEIEQRSIELADWQASSEAYRLDAERLRAAIAYVRQRSQRACEILNEFDNTHAVLEPKP